MIIPRSLTIFNPSFPTSSMSFATLFSIPGFTKVSGRGGEGGTFYLFFRINLEGLAEYPFGNRLLP